MADHPRFGPAGMPITFRTVSNSVIDVPAYLRSKGLDAFEYQAVRWGQKPQIKKENAAVLGENAKLYDVWLSMHGSYYINLAGEKNVRESSRKRLIACVTAANWMKANVMVFHVGYYGRYTSREALKLCSKTIADIIEELKILGIESVSLGLETSGRRSQIGSLEEIVSLCELTEKTQPVIDWSHLHARDWGRLKTIEDFRKVIDKIESRLGTFIAKNLHCHFSKIEFTNKGERCHHTLEEKKYGPDFRLLAKVIAEIGLNPVIISESPILDIDALKMQKMVMEELKHTRKRAAD